MVGAGLASALPIKTPAQSNENPQIEFTELGRIIEKQWRDIPNRFENVEIGEFIIMPNHIHGILILHQGRVIIPLGAAYSGSLPVDNTSNWSIV